MYKQHPGVHVRVRGPGYSTHVVLDGTRCVADARGRARDGTTAVTQHNLKAGGGLQMGVCGECIASMTLDSATRECTVLMACEARLGWARLLHYITLHYAANVGA